MSNDRNGALGDFRRTTTRAGSGASIAPAWHVRHVAQWLLLPLAAIAAFLATAAPPLLPPTVSLSADPLYAIAAGDKPAIVLALSVEYPTVGAQYVSGVLNSTEDDTYSSDKEYLGYYDAESCYRYNDAPNETRPTGVSLDDYKRFDRIGGALPLTVSDPVNPKKTSRKCSDAFSGNFLNWASNSAIDMLRLALTGGDRFVDTPTLTILQRAVIPNGDPICMWNSSNFPAKRLKKNGGAAGSYWGAVPNVMVTGAGGKDIFVGNTLNRIYFATSSGGGCNNTSGYTLGSAPVVANRGPVVYSTANQPPGLMTYCAAENGTCSGFSGVKEVLYGAGNGSNSNWMIARATSGVGCSNATFGDPIPGTPKACYYRDVTSESTAWTPPANTGALNSDGFFYSRVQVCESNSAGGLLDDRDYELCKRYPNGNFKPTGAVQKYSDQLRLAAFGYLMDQTASYNAGGRYGGVLRAPMKYVGAKDFDINGVEKATANAKNEWNASTGVFVTNPEGDTTFNKSGVITYLNQFGRTGPTGGRYKIYDPVGELHYEALRYLQGLQPSADAVAGLSNTPLNTDALYDGFPVAKTWIDPYGDGRSKTADYSCLKSNIVVIGDINTHDGNRTPAPNAAANVLDIRYWRGIVQAFEKNLSTMYVDGQGTNRSVGNPNGANSSVPTANGGSQIMGSAYWAHTHDIRGANWTVAPGPDLQRLGLRVKTFVFDVNEYGAQNNVSTRRYANQFFMAGKYGGFEADPSNQNRKPFNTGGNPFKRDDGTVDNAVWSETDPSSPRNSEASTYYLQSDARGVLSAFDAIFKRAGTEARSIAGGALNSKNLATGSSAIYQGVFDTLDWSGDLVSIPLIVDANNATSTNPIVNWSASKKLAARFNPASQGALANARNIVMGRAGATANPTATPFLWTSGVDASVKAALDKPSPSSAADGLGEERLKYLRGDRSLEGSTFRTRQNAAGETKLLGDIINSGVVYSGVPSNNIIGGGYAAFYAANANNPPANVARTPAVFVGANDGMLHGFNADDGEELFGYIPSWLAPRLSALTSRTYAANHQVYVDGQLAVAEAKLGSGDTAADWATVLVGTTAGGGQGVFALDVTDPTAFNQGKVMWEFTDADDPDLGNVVGRPQILKLRVNDPAATTPVFKYFAVFGSGVNNQAVDGNASTTGNPALYLLDLTKKKGVAWINGASNSANGNYFKVTLPFVLSGTDLTTTAAGLVNFSAAKGLAGQVTKIYMGDLHGNVWKLDFTKLGSADWNMEKLSSFKRGSTAPFTPYPLYTARDNADKIQPITMAPAIAYGPTPDTAYVMFGTGKYLESGDKLSVDPQSVYAVFDNGKAAADSSPISAAIKSRKRLQKGTVSTTTGMVTVPAFNWGRPMTDSDVNQRSGWYFDLPKSGERSVSNATVIPKTNTAVFGSLIPATSSTSGACGANAGGGNQYTVNLATGNASFSGSTAGILGEPLLVEITSAMRESDSDSTGKREKTVHSQIIEQGSIGVSVGREEISKIRTGRLSWRQINNYIDLKNAAP